MQNINEYTVFVEKARHQHVTLSWRLKCSYSWCQLLLIMLLIVVSISKLFLKINQFQGLQQTTSSDFDQSNMFKETYGTYNSVPLPGTSDFQPEETTYNIVYNYDYNISNIITTQHIHENQWFFTCVWPRVTGANVPLVIFAFYLNSHRPQ